MAPSRCWGTKRGVQPTFNGESGVAPARNHRQVGPGLQLGRIGTVSRPAPPPHTTTSLGIL
ncbi:DUF1589 domain-containing protein [Rhodopirellula europaea]|uniref:DUF1589 domain-containing protein n=1 Tax=Rhodopirellula europaea TaxID=1263866 RepID=UPI0011818311